MTIALVVNKYEEILKGDKIEIQPPLPHLSHNELLNKRSYLWESKLIGEPLILSHTWIGQLRKIYLLII